MNELVRLAKEGNQTALSKLYLQCEPMIRNYTRKYKNLNCLEPEDLVQYGAYYFMTALEKFDLNRDLKFSTFLHTQLQQIYRNVVYEDFVVRRSTSHIAEVKADPSAGYKALSLDSKMDDEGNQFHEVYADESANFELDIEASEDHAEFLKVLKSELDSLDPIPRTVVELGIYTNIKQPQIAEYLGIQLHQVRRYLKYFRRDMTKRCAKVQTNNL